MNSNATQLTQLADALLDTVGGGQATDPNIQARIRENTDLAERVCGKGNVKEVTDRGYSCK